jgi:hypothetical protein
VPSPETKLSIGQNLQPVPNGTLERLWHSALELLQAELPRATFDTWVRDAEPLSYDGEAFLIGVANAYARDWLEERLCEVSRRILSQVVGHAVEVCFAVDDDLQTRRQDRSNPPASQVDSSKSTGYDPEGHSEPDQRFELALQFRRYWEEIVDPEKVVSISRYFVNYWLPILGPYFSSMVLAFKQMRYLHQARAEEPFEALGSEILQWLCVDESTFYRRLNQPHPLLSWFIEEAPSIGPRYERTKSGKVRRKPRKYLVYGGVPLSPPHQVAIEKQLIEFGVGPDPSKTIQALETALKLPDEEWEGLLERSFEAYLAQGAADHPPKARSVVDMVRDLLSDEATGSPIERIVALAEDLENRLVHPDRAILLTWYFVREWQPLLSSAAFWLLILLRSRGFYDKRKTELRDTFWVEGGYAELGSKLGVSSETIAGWLGQNRKASQTKISQYVSSFVHELDRSRGRNSDDRRSLSLQLKVAMIDPLTPSSELRLAEMARQDGIPLQDLFHLQPNTSEIRKFGYADYPENVQLGFDEYTEIPQFGVEYQPEIRQSETLQSPENHKFDQADSPEKDLYGEVHTPEFSKSGREGQPEKIQHLNNLITTQSDQNTFPSKTTFSKTTTDTINQLLLPMIYEAKASEREQVVVVNIEKWSLEKLCQNNQVPPGMVRELRRKDIDPEHFAAWVMYACSEQGRGIAKPGIFAAKSLLEEPPILPSQVWLQLAQRGPDFIQNEITHALTSFYAEADMTWQSAMRETPRSRLIKLARALGMELQELNQ